MPLFRGTLHQGHLPHPGGPPGEQVQSQQGFSYHPKSLREGGSLQEEKNRDHALEKCKSIFPGDPKWYPIVYLDETFLKVRREGVVGIWKLISSYSDTVFPQTTGLLKATSL